MGSRLNPDQAEALGGPRSQLGMTEAFPLPATHTLDEDVPKMFVCDMSEFLLSLLQDRPPPLWVVLLRGPQLLLVALLGLGSPCLASID